MRILHPSCFIWVKRRLLSYDISKGRDRLIHSMVSPSTTYSNSPFEVNLFIMYLLLHAGLTLNHAPSPTPPRYCASCGTAVGLAEKSIKPTISSRSEERRVGKECRSRWSQYI